MAARLVAAGFPQEDVRVLVPPGNAKKGNLVARLRGNGTQKPLLLLAHLDVVEAHKEDWSADLDPFKLIERDGYYYGRGTADDKAMAAIFVANLIRYRQEGLKPRRDIILALTADEEGGDYNGVSWLVDEHRALIEAEFGLNEGGGGRERDGKKLFNAVQATEKLYRDFDLEVTNKGGHSSVPVPRQRDLSAVRGAGSAQQVRLPGQPQRSHACILRAHGRTRRRRPRRGDEGRRAVERRRRERGRDVGADSRVQLDAAHDLRRDDVAGRPCTQCLAAEGDGERQLPHPAAGVGAGRAAARSRVCSRTTRSK